VEGALSWTIPTAAFTLWYYLSAPVAASLAERVPSLAPAAFASVVRKFSGGIIFAAVWILWALVADDPHIPTVTVPLLVVNSGFGGIAATCGLALTLAGFVAISSRSPKMHALYPEFRQPTASPSQRALSASSWMVYLAGYELLFRGVILSVAISALGLWAGIAAHTALYVLAHLHKPAGETLSCFLIGPVFALVALEYGIVAAWFVHCAVAITGEQVSGTTNPQTNWTLRT
jgi:membrane protease YdiL (CAAX protease family)